MLIIMAVIGCNSHEGLIASTSDLILELGHRKVTTGSILRTEETPVEQPTSPIENVSPAKDEASSQMQPSYPCSQILVLMEVC